MRAERYELLKQHAQKEARRLRLGDEIETILYYHVRLKEALDLPITTYGMLYPGMSGVTDEMLAEAATTLEAISDEDLLSMSEHWRAHLQKQGHRTRFEEIDAKFSDALENVNQQVPDAALPENPTDLQRSREKELCALTRELTEPLHLFDQTGKWMTA